MTEVKAVKVSKETYAKLCEIAGELQIKLKRPVSIEEAMKHLIWLRKKGVKITDLGGSWNKSVGEHGSRALSDIRISLLSRHQKNHISQQGLIPHPLPGAVFSQTNER